MNENDNINISAETMGQLPPLYQKELQKLIAELNNTQSDVHKLRILREFSGKFVCILNLWEVQTKLEQILAHQNIDFPENNNNNLRLNLCFFSEKYGNSKELKWNHSEVPPRDHLFEKSWHSYYSEPERVLTFPHRELRKGYWMYEKACVNPVTKELNLKFDRALFLWNKFVVNDGLTNEAFLGYLAESEDEKVVVGLIEHRLGWKMGCLDKKLWEFYKEYMKNRCQIGLLSVYQKYTRFFAEDKSAVKEYRQEIERVAKIPMAVSKFWIDTILYELDFGDKKTAANLMEQILRKIGCFKSIPFFDGPNLVSLEFIEILRSSDRNILPEFKISKKSPIRIQCYYPIQQKSAWKKTQNFFLPRPTILYMTKAANYKILQKLFILCKFFFAVQPTPLCHRLVLGWPESSQYIGHSLFLNHKDLNFPGLWNLHITSILDALFSEDSWDYGRALGNVIAKVSKCSAQIGDIYNQELSLEEFKFLYPCEEMVFSLTYVYNEDVSCAFFPGQLRDHWDCEKNFSNRNVI